MTSDYVFDEREDDDMATGHPVPTVQVILGDHGTVDATTDGTLVFTDERTGSSFEVGFTGPVHVMRLLREVALAGEETAYFETLRHRADIRLAARTAPKPTARPATHPSVFAVLTEGAPR